MVYNILLIEDSEEDRQLFVESVRRINIQNIEKKIEVEYNLIEASSYDEGLEKIKDVDMQGIIVDVKLDKGHSGIDVIRNIVHVLRVPVVIFTGTPKVDTFDELAIRIPVYTKGEATHEEILEQLCAFSETGLFKVLCRKGIIDEEMTRVFWQVLFPRIDYWKREKDEGLDTEKILLRYAISHIHELIDSNVVNYDTEETYIYQPGEGIITTGSIVKSKDEVGIVLSPPCDLVKYDGNYKTDRILVCEIDNNNLVITNVSGSGHSIGAAKAAIENREKLYYHWLPACNGFEGGFINFRKVHTYSVEEFADKFIELKIKVQEYFVKNILNRFSSYYSRQGQPNYDSNKEAEKLVTKMKEEKKL